MDPLALQVDHIKRTFLSDAWKKTLDNIVTPGGRFIPKFLARVTVTDWMPDGWSFGDMDLDRIDGYMHDNMLFVMMESCIFPLGPYGILIIAEVANVTLGYRCTVMLAWDLHNEHVYRVDTIAGNGPITDFVNLEALEIPAKKGIHR